MNNYFIILAAGKSKRFNSKIRKQYIQYKNKPLFMHSIDIASKSKIFKKIILVLNKIDKSLKIKNVETIVGGKERYQSSINALKYIKNRNIKNVFIHDAARPNFSIKLLKRLQKNLKNNNAVIPFIKTNNSAKYVKKNKIINLNRNKIYLTQTPQCFDFKTLYKLSLNNKNLVSDEAELFIEKNKKIKFINGEINNLKITTKEDIGYNKDVKYGIGFDVHRLIPKKKLYLAGIKIPSTLGTLGHSDGDPVLHAIIDSILGACQMGDIGEKFSSKNKKYKNIRSTILLKKIIHQIKMKNYSINNIDINIITQKPKISMFKKKMIRSITKICEISNNQINIKGKTAEKLGLIGKEKAIACEVITSVIKYD